MSFDRRTVRTRDGRVIGVIPTPTGPDWDGNFGVPRYEECILCGRDTSGENRRLGRELPRSGRFRPSEPGYMPGQVADRARGVLEERAPPNGGDQQLKTPRSPARLPSREGCFPPVGAVSAVEMVCRHGGRQRGLTVESGLPNCRNRRGLTVESEGANRRIRRG